VIVREARDLSEPRVLVVDDEEGPREAIRMILKPRYEVYTAGSGEEVLAALPGIRPDVIFMDVKMPRIDGVQLLERVKATDPQVEVVMITAYASLDTVQRAMRFGAMDYLVKPFAPKELQEAAERALTRRRQRVGSPTGTLAPLIGQMRDLAHRGDAAEGAGHLSGLLRAMLREAERAAGALAASFFGTEPAAVVHSDPLADAGDVVPVAWKRALTAVREPLVLRPGVAAHLAWPAPLPSPLREVGGLAVVPVGDEGVPRVAGHLVLWLARPVARPELDLGSLRPVIDLMVTSIRTASLLRAAARQAAEQSLRAVQREILRQISAAVLEDPSLDRTLAAITEQLQQGAGYERVQVLLEPTDPPEPDRSGRAVFALVAQGRRLGYLVAETDRSRDLDRSERELLRMFSESVALIVRNANLHRELSEAKSFLENLIQSAAEAIVAVDPEGRVVTWNPAAERLFEHPAAEARGRRLEEVLPSALATQLEPARDGVQGGHVVQIQTRSDAAAIDLTVSCAPIPWGGRGDTGRLVVARDVTEHRRWEEQMARSEKLAALGQLAMGMAHDFTNLLQAILGHTQLIANEPSPERLGKGLATIEQAVRDGVETVGRIKRFARREGDRRLERVDLREVVRQAIEMVRPRWAHGDRDGVISVRQRLGAVLPVQARAAELREVVINLVLNAVDAMAGGGIITVETRQDSDWAVLDVADTGPGIAPDVKRRIFEPFFTTKETGTGLGLSIVSGIVSSHGGTITVESEPGAGTTFTIRLPAVLPARA
jgi:PAS domain S-box-containing protein